MVQEFGDTWKEEEDLKWYKKILENPEDDTVVDEDDEMENECDCLEEDVGLHI